jgi:hypothetical protein
MAGATSSSSQVGPSPADGAKPRVFGFTLTDDQMARSAAMDTGATLFFDHRDPAMVSAIGNRPIHD